MIVSVHIPKSGGSSFRQNLIQEYGDQLWVDYSRQWSRTDAPLANIPTGIKCLHGHFEADAFESCFTNHIHITWIRHPVSRIVSLYNHILLKPDMENTYIREIHVNKPNLVEFAEIDWVRNHMLQYIGTKLPEDFAFIGILEEYEESIKRCANILSWRHVPVPIWSNRNTDSSKTLLTKEESKKILQLNREDMDWYQAAKSLHST